MIDAYTRSVLTVIAAALVGIAVQHAVGNVWAQSDRLQRVVVCSAHDTRECLSLVPIGYPSGSDRYGIPTFEQRR
ncbi:hypothetical protein [Rhodoplanes sp. SY1]|uniref:hypothetical protein n=1 Tax=Rhodoplanes sp. SY1 TaxID=3166646 RepID=UPI0038B4F579